MSTELMVLAWGGVLGLVHIFAAGHVKTKQYGAKWNMGPRDEALSPPEPIVGRMMRAQANFFETFPIMAAAILIVSIAHLTSQWTQIGAIVWLGARVAFLPLYIFGVTGVRSAAFLISLAGLLMVLWPALF